VGHNDAVSSVAWSPQHSMQFASGGSDRKVVIWDIDRLNMNSKEKVGHEILVSWLLLSSYTLATAPGSPT
jgi:WD40 repeat protein